MRRKFTQWPTVNPLHSTKTMVVPRDTTPQTAAMLHDAKHALAAQLAHFRHISTSEAWDLKTASAFQKCIASLSTLQHSEKNVAEELSLGSLTQDELARLCAQSTKLLQRKATESDPNSPSDTD